MSATDNIQPVQTGELNKRKADLIDQVKNNNFMFSQSKFDAVQEEKSTPSRHIPSPKATPVAKVDLMRQTFKKEDLLEVMATPKIKNFDFSDKRENLVDEIVSWE